MRVVTIDELRHAVLPLMDGFPAPWGVAGGWAIDVFLGRVTRSHADVELAVFRQDQVLLYHHFAGWGFNKAIDRRREAWEEGEWLQLPIHELPARRATASSETIEFLLGERDADNWAYRRDPSIQMPVEQAFVRTGVDLPFLAPEIVLLFKSKLPREKDTADLVSTAPALDVRQRRWLVRAISAAEPEHPWLRTIAAANGGHA